MPANFAFCVLDDALRRHPGKTAIIFEETRLDYARLARNVHALAAELRRRNVTPGDRVALLLPDSPALVSWFLAALAVGAVATPINERASLADREFILHDAALKLLVLDAGRDHGTNWDGAVLTTDLAEPARNLPEAEAVFAPGGDAPGFMLYTSGSTGKPKGVPHSHDDLAMQARVFAPAVLGDAANDVFLSSSKISFAYGLGAQIGLALGLGATLVLHPGPPDPDVLMALIARHGVNAFFSVPTVYQSLLRARSGQENLSSLRLCYSAGEAMPAPVGTALRDWLGLDVLDGLGSTESAFVFLSNRPGAIRSGTLGCAVPGYEVRLVDESGAGVEPGRSGRLRVRGPGVATKYWNRPESTAKAMLPGGWLETGDLCVEENGFYRYQGRADDMIKTGGVWVSPVLVEDCLQAHPAVAECGVAALILHGLVYPAAHVVPASGVEPDPGLAQELRRHVRAHLPKHMVPVRVEFLADLPRTATGKIQRHKLRR
ncbi:MAG: benzoate-CoA ligase family protein [Deltaproteobacteria bacterium]|nr:benzoate-CoA ligase family protein [Deltaproteobacteria bacterium]